MEGMLNYFVPEDGDSSDHLNVVPLPRVDQLRLQHVKKVHSYIPPREGSLRASLTPYLLLFRVFRASLCLATSTSASKRRSRALTVRD